MNNDTNNTMNFRVLKRGEVHESNYALRQAPLNLKATVHSVCEAPGTDVWEGEGGFVPQPVEVTDKERYRSNIRIRPAKKQRAAKCYIPKESIKVVSMSKPVARGVAIAIYEGKTEQEIEIAALEARVRELMFQVSRPNPTPTPGKPQPDIDALINLFEARKRKV